ncbi:Fe-S cluster biogenesis protein NfuA [Anaeroplasma bactoclasticum]|jgi:Fe-S cluster biogenesis protein NfuA|uniref:Fe-S cluster biogenesis protein NfuA n=2 Tax=Anaeroplasma bactoclasticum TaxID=2088 RepID=A0A397QT56_9MOLU|nr:NifU family protein [Anaeroplasma bactoclasticum]RIA64760.1 Fe-S cluster biogenesis protein NfuA [Anaeroplasma bactoclasticum]
MENKGRTTEEILGDIDKVLDKIRPYLNSEGGDIEMLKFEDGIVYVKMMGACVDCGALDSTLTDGVEALLMEYVPEVIGVKNVVDEL